MISAEKFYKKYYDSFPFAKTDKFGISVVMTDNADFLFGIVFFERYHLYIFDMLKPEVVAINKWYEPKYIPLSKNDIELIMDGLINKHFWEGLIERYKNHIDTTDNLDMNDNPIYTLESLNKIPATPPDYRLIWENGYTGEEDYDFTSYDYG